MRRVFVDTGAFGALFMPNDRDHGRVLQVIRGMNVPGVELITTNAVAFETYVLILHRSRRGRVDALRFLDLIERKTLRIVRVSARDERAAFALVRAHADKTYSLCDAASFVIMERLRIREAVALDDDFRAYGRFEVLP